MTPGHTGYPQHEDVREIADAIAALSAGLFTNADGPPYAEVLAQLADVERRLAALSEQIRASELESLSSILHRAARHAAVLSSKPALSDEDVLALADAMDEIVAQTRHVPEQPEPPSQASEASEPAGASTAMAESGVSTDELTTSVPQESAMAAAGEAILADAPAPDAGPSDEAAVVQDSAPSAAASAIEPETSPTNPAAAEEPAIVELAAPGPEQPIEATAVAAESVPVPPRDPIADVLELDTLAGSVAALEEHGASAAEDAPQLHEAAAETPPPPTVDPTPYEPTTSEPVAEHAAGTALADLPSTVDAGQAAVEESTAFESPGEAAAEPDTTAVPIVTDPPADTPSPAMESVEVSAVPSADPLPVLASSAVEAPAFEMVKSEEHPSAAAQSDASESAALPPPSEPAPADAVEPLVPPTEPAASAIRAPTEPSRENDCWASLQIDPTSVARVDLVTKLDAGQQAIVSSLAKDARSIAAELNRVIDRLRAGGDPSVAPMLATMSDGLARTGSFFNFSLLSDLADLLKKVGEGIEAAPPQAMTQLAHVLPGVALVLALFGDGLESGYELQVPVGRLIESALVALAGALPEPAAPSATSEAAAEAPTADPGAAAELTPEQMLAMLGAEQESCGWGTVPLSLPPEKAETLQFLVNDIKQAADQINGPAEHLADLGVRGDTCAELIRLESVLERAMRDFEFRSLRTLIRLVGDIGCGLEGVVESMLPELAVRLLAVQSLIQQHAGALEVGMETTWPLDTLVARIHRLLSGQTLAPSIVGWHRGNVERVTELDLVVEGVEPPPKVDPQEDRASWTRPAAGVAKSVTDDLIRVRAAVIDQLLGTVGELVQHNARLHMVSTQLRREQPRLPGIDDLCRTSELMQRAMVALQTGIMGTRMQPIARLLDNYPRVARDVGRLADREVQLTVSGGETLVDRSLLEAISEPLMMIVRCIASTLIEPPADRQKAGKPASGSIFVTVAQRGSQVVLTLEDDGAGFDRSTVAAQVVDAGLLTAEQAAALPDTELYALLMEPDLPGSPLRGVGTTLSSSIGASFRIASTPGQGTRIDLFIPMKSVILPSVVVAVGAAQYTVPLSSVLEIVKIEDGAVKTVGRAPCLRLRGDVLALVDARELLAESAGTPASYAIVITNGLRVAALAVDRVINKQDMIIAQIEDEKLRKGPFSGTTLTQEGRVSLVIDVQRVLALVVDTQTSP